MAILSMRAVALSLALFGSTLWGQTFELLHSFPASGADGTDPAATLTEGPDGSLYGTASFGGDHSAGTIFKVSLTTGQVTILDDFETATTGQEPVARLVNPGDGSLYGVTRRNGNGAGDPVGTVYRLDSAGTLSVVFQLKLATGAFPRNPQSLVAAEPGTVHVLGYEPGGLWRVSLDGSGGSVTRNFSSTVSEGSFHEKIIRGSDGFLYGGSYAGGDSSNGILFRVAPDGSGFERLHSCDRATGIRPVGAMVEGPDGYFYGTMNDGGQHNGVIFRISPGGGDYTVIHHFADFRYPGGDLMIATDGYIYGTATLGGANGNGNGGVFRIKPNGTGYKIVYTFNTARTEPFYPDGRAPIGGLVQGADGNLYGTTSGGGEGNEGTVFRLKLKLPLPPVNRPPVAVADYAVSSGAPVTIAVKANDFDPDEDALSVTIDTQPEFGTVAVQSNGSILYTPVGYAGFDTFTYKVSDQRGGSSVATVTIQNTPPGPLLVAGNYNGLLGFAPGQVPQGRFVLSVRADGKFTGTLFIQKKRVPLKGTFKENGTAVISVNIPKQGRRELFLFFKSGTPNTVGAVVFGQELWAGEAGLTIAATSDKTRTYTVQIESDDSNASMPAGYGYGVVTLKPTGAVSMVGTLGDGSKLAWSSTLTKFKNTATSIPIFAEPLAGGVFAAIVEGNEANGFESEARWIRPRPKKQTGPYGFFDGIAGIAIAPFTKPASTDPVIDLADGVVGVFDGPIITPTSGIFRIAGKKITSEGALRKLTINRDNGLFSGSIVADRKTLTFKGVINQASKSGVGSVTVKGGETGKVELFRPID